MLSTINRPAGLGCQHHTPAPRSHRLAPAATQRRETGSSTPNIAWPTFGSKLAVRSLTGPIYRQQSMVCAVPIAKCIIVHTLASSRSRRSSATAWPHSLRYKRWSRRGRLPTGLNRRGERLPFIVRFGLDLRSGHGQAVDNAVETEPPGTPAWRRNVDRSRPSTPGSAVDGHMRLPNLGAELGKRCADWRVARVPTLLGTVLGGVMPGQAGSRAVIGAAGQVDNGGRCRPVRWSVRWCARRCRRCRPGRRRARGRARWRCGARSCWCGVRQPG